MSTQINSVKRDSLISRARDVLKPKRSRKLRGHQSVVYDPDGDSWSPDEHGQDYRYGQRQPHHHAKRAYQAAAAIAYQDVTHAPFHMEEIGREPTLPSPRQISEEPPVTPRRTYRPTRFYPEGGQDDAVQPIRAVGRAQLQKVLPSYELSTAETRESGLGPSLETL